jgi:hypothetical protein
MSSNAVGRRGCGVSASEYSCAHGAQINIGDLTSYLTYGKKEPGKFLTLFKIIKIYTGTYYDIGRLDLPVYTEVRAARHRRSACDTLYRGVYNAGHT